MASAVSGLAPSLTAVPTWRISAAISRPCRAIQALCHISMTTAIDEHAGIEQFLAGALEGFRDGAGESGDHGRAEHAGDHADA